MQITMLNATTPCISIDNIFIDEIIAHTHHARLLVNNLLLHRIFVRLHLLAKVVEMIFARWDNFTILLRIIQPVDWQLNVLLICLFVHQILFAIIEVIQMQAMLLPLLL